MNLFFVNGENYPHHKNLIEKENCFIVLGHEISQKTFVLSESGKKRCELLAKEILKITSKNYFVIFMGLGRLQGECDLSISECMYNYFSKKFFKLDNYILEKYSLDTIGDAVFSKKLIDDINFKNKITIITSDWHLNRVKIIFRKIYNLKDKINFLGSSELSKFNSNENEKILKKEEESIKLFNEFIYNYDNNLSNLYSYLIENHNCYKK